MASKSIFSEGDIIQFYDSFSSEWWNGNGMASFIHTSNNVIYPYIKETITQHVLSTNISLNAERPFVGLNILDIGCGGGVLSERLAKSGATVTGIDINPKLIHVAKEHAQLNLTISSQLSYFVESIEEHAKNNKEKYDIIIIQYVLPHVHDKERFLDNSTKCLKQDGLILLSTVNSNWITWFYYKILVRGILGIYPDQFCDTANYSSPESISSILRKNGVEVKETRGLYFNFLKHNFCWSNTTCMDYVLCATKS